MKTYSAKENEVAQNWLHIDASDVILGRLATQVAVLLRGKHKPEFTPHMDVGDYVIVTNCKYIKVSGDKEHNKTYAWHTGYPGGIKTTTLAEKRKKDATDIIYLAVKRMLPRGPLGNKMLKKLKLFNDEEHNHHAQKVTTISATEK
jgi:large subunit ribosomal protein L13